MAHNPLEDPKNKKMLELFIIEHAPVINMHANRMLRAGIIPHGTDMTDVHMAGVHGLVEALHKYDPEVSKRVNRSFLDLARSQIKGRMLDHVKDSLGVPSHIVEKYKNVSKRREGELAAAPQPAVAPPASPAPEQKTPGATPSKEVRVRRATPPAPPASPPPTGPGKKPAGPPTGPGKKPAGPPTGQRR